MYKRHRPGLLVSGLCDAFLGGLCDGPREQLEWQLEQQRGRHIRHALVIKTHAAPVFATLQVAKTRVRVREMKAALHLMQALHRGGQYGRLLLWAWCD